MCRNKIMCMCLMVTCMQWNHMCIACKLKVGFVYIILYPRSMQYVSSMISNNFLHYTCVILSKLTGDSKPVRLCLDAQHAVI